MHLCPEPLRAAAPLLPASLVLLLALVSLPAGAAAAEAAARAPRKLAIPEVRARGGVEPGAVEGLGALIASEVAREPSLHVLAASDIVAMLGFEKERELLGCNDSSCLAELGGALGVDLVLATEVSRVGQTYLLSLALVDIRKARPLARVTRTTAAADGLVGASREAVAEILIALRAGTAVAPATASQPAVAGSDGSVQRIAGLSLVGLGVALAATGTWQGLAARSAAEEVGALAAGGGAWDPGAQQLEADGQAAGTRALVLGGAGGAALVGGALLYLLAPEAPAPAGVTASIAGGGAGLSWTARY